MGAANTIQNTVNANQGNLDQMASDIRGYLPGLAEKAFGDDPLLSSANQYATDVLGGKYLDEGNPYLQGMIDQTAGDVSDRVNAMFAKSGSALGTRHAGVLSKELANAENSLRYTNYGNERNAMGQAAGLAPALTTAEVGRIAPYLAATETAAGLPFAGIGNLGMIGSLFGGYGTQTQTQSGGWGSGILGALGSLGAAAITKYSDRRLKSQIVKVGEEPDGLNIYEFVYNFDPSKTVQRGVMADEVARLRPWALGPERNGYMTVNYGKLREAA